MARPLATTGLLTLLTFLPAVAVAADEPSLSGLWHGALGVVRLTQSDGRVTAHHQYGGACDFLPERRILEAHLEGNVLVGSITLCQRGTACGEKVYPLMAFYNPDDGSLAAHLRLDPGCESPALEGGVLRLQAGDDPLQRPAGSARAVARQKSPQRNSDLAIRAFTQARRLLEKGDYAGAREQYLLGLSYDEENWAAYNLLGVTQMKLDNPSGAIEAYRRASLLNGTDPIIFYNLACAFSRTEDRTRALENLRLAVRHGFTEANAMSTDKDLTRLLGNDPEFKALLVEVRERTMRGPRSGRR